MTLPGNDQTSQQPAENTPEWFRSTIERQKAENAELRGKLMDRTFQAVGIDTTKGIGKTMRDLYDGDDDPEALKSWAAEKFEWAPQAGNQSTGHTAEQTAAQQVVAESQDRVEKATEGAQSVDPPPAGSLAELKAKVAEAEAKGDHATAISLKRQWTQELARKS